jgi:hypothetical protein
LTVGQSAEFDDDRSLSCKLTGELWRGDKSVSCRNGFGYEADDRFMGGLGEGVVPSKAGVIALFGGSCGIERENARDRKIFVFVMLSGLETGQFEPLTRLYFRQHAILPGKPWLGR